ncbi:aminotransferase class V-fold PLP-dependent enzyme, partial [Escherichia coli]|nr:aminotransferase class V-fold PLP-dependent enzyme [Escherichia coli]
ADCTLDLEHLQSLLSEKTRLVAVTYASNTTGSIVDIQRVVDMAHGVGAQVYVDAVHYAPHHLVDVQALGCDFLACSAYKFFGPHVGI